MLAPRLTMDSCITHKVNGNGAHVTKQRSSVARCLHRVWFKRKRSVTKGKTLGHKWSCMIGHPHHNSHDFMPPSRCFSVCTQEKTTKNIHDGALLVDKKKKECLCGMGIRITPLSASAHAHAPQGTLFMTARNDHLNPWWRTQIKNTEANLLF